MAKYFVFIQQVTSLLNNMMLGFLPVQETW